MNDLYNSIGLARELLKVYLKFSYTIDKLTDVEVGVKIATEVSSQKFDLMGDSKEKSANHMFNKGIFQQEMLSKKLIKICELIIQDIERHYEGSKFMEEISRF